MFEKVCFLEIWQVSSYYLYNTYRSKLAEVFVKSRLSENIKWVLIIIIYEKPVRQVFVVLTYILLASSANNIECVSLSVPLLTFSDPSFHSGFCWKRILRETRANNFRLKTPAFCFKHGRVLATFTNNPFRNQNKCGFFNENPSYDFNRTILVELITQ